MDFLLRQRLSVTVEKGLQNIHFKTKDMRLKINDKIYRLKEIESGVDSLMELVEEPKCKNGDFVVGLGCIFILHKQIDEDSAQFHVLYARTNGMLWYDKLYQRVGDIDKLRLATEAEKQELLDALAKEGKRWNEEEKCIEDIPEKLKKGDFAIFWDDEKKYAAIRFYERLDESDEHLQHIDNIGFNWKNAIKFESKEQYEKLIKGEL